MNQIFLTAITGECALMQLSGLRPRAYNPFVLLCQELKKYDIEINPRNRKACFDQLAHIYKENGLAPHSLLDKAIQSLSKKNKSHEN